MTCLIFYSVHSYLEYMSRLSLTAVGIYGVCVVCLTYENKYVWARALEGLKENSQNARSHNERAHLQLKGHNNRLTLYLTYLFIYLRHGLTL